MRNRGRGVSGRGGKVVAGVRRVVAGGEGRKKGLGKGGEKWVARVVVRDSDRDRKMERGDERDTR